MILPLLAATALALTPDDAQVILQIEAQRLPPLALARYVADEDAETRARAARALGRLRTAAAVAPLKRLAADDDPSVRAEAAFALGLTPGAGPVALARLAEESDPTVRARLLTALGTQGEGEAVPALLSALAEPPRLLRRPDAQIAAAKALGRMGMREVEAARAPDVTRALLEALRRPDVHLTRAAAFALARQGAGPLPAPVGVALVDAARRAGDGPTRALLVRAVAASGAEAHGLLDDLADDHHPGVRVALARAAAATDWPGVTALLDDEDEGVVLEAIAALGRVDAPDRRGRLEALLAAGGDLEAAEAWRAARDPRLHRAAAALSALAQAGLLEDLTPWTEVARPTRVRVAAVQELDDPARLAALALEDGEGPVRTAAASALVAREPDRKDLVPLISAFDPMVAAIAADALTERPTGKAEAPLLAALAESETPDLLAAGLRALHAMVSGSPPKVRKPDPATRDRALALLDHPAGPVRDAARALLAALDATSDAPPPPSWHHIVTAPLDEVARARTVRLRTTQGEVILELFPEEAPVTVWSFTQLAEAGWFDRLTFHRVVPDFVVQTGDPRGDGMGGPSFTVPDEPNPVPYEAGVVGMALAGPDTGGSQWFVTLSPQPHLDGTYTVFGRVVRGLEVLRRLREGDRIERLTVEWQPEPAG